MAPSTFGSASDKTSGLKDKATDQFSKAADQAEGMANRVAEHGREAGARMQEGPPDGDVWLGLPSSASCSAHFGNPSGD
jgi:hypothetical protein